MLVSAQRPLIVTERTARTPGGMKLMIELAETLQAPVSNLERMDFPNRHPLAGSGGALANKKHGRLSGPIPAQPSRGCMNL